MKTYIFSRNNQSSKQYDRKSQVVSNQVHLENVPKRARFWCRTCETCYRTLSSGTCSSEGNYNFRQHACLWLLLYWTHTRVFTVSLKTVSSNFGIEQLDPFYRLFNYPHSSLQNSANSFLTSAEITWKERSRWLVEFNQLDSF